MIRDTAVWAAAFIVVAACACKKAPPGDNVCIYEPLPATAEVKAGQGAVMTRAATDTYFYALDEAGKQIGSAHVNGILALQPGDYRVKVNNSVHPAAVTAKTLTTCSTGGVLVSGKTDEYYYVLDNAGTQLASAHVGAALSLFPGNYQIRLNNSTNPAAIPAGAIFELKPGTINVEASTDEYYYVFNTAGTQIASSHLGKPLGLFAASYTVKINNSVSKADVRAGEATNIPAGTLVVQGSTDEYYYVFDKSGTQLASAHLGRPLSLVPGDYIAKLNNAPMPVQSEAGRANEYLTGTVTVRSSGSGYYYALDLNGTQLGSKQLGAPMSLPAGKYSVKVGNDARSVEVTNGQAAVINW